MVNNFANLSLARWSAHVGLVANLAADFSEPGSHKWLGQLLAAKADLQDNQMSCRQCTNIANGRFQSSNRDPKFCFLRWLKSTEICIRFLWPCPELYEM